MSACITQLFIKYGCLRENSFYEKIKDSVIYKDLNDNYITMNEYLEKVKDKHENKVFYVSDLEKQAQFIKLFKEYDLDAVILNTQIDNNFISFLEYSGGSNVKFARVDSDLSDVLKEEVTEVNEEKRNNLIDLFKNIFKDKIKEYSVESLKKEETPAMILISEESRRMKEMQAQFGKAGLGEMAFGEDKKLVINEKNSIINNVLELSKDEKNKDKVEMICKQIVDLAMINNQDLDSNSLELFIKRSNEIMKMMM